MTLALAFLAGIVTAFSPCVLPLLPVILVSAVQQGRLRPWGVLTGFVVSFTVATLLLAALVSLAGFDPDAVRTVSGFVILACGVVLAVPYLSHRFEALAGGAATLGAKIPDRGGFWGGLVLGSGLGLAWTPCVGPIMASVISLALSQAVTADAALTAVAFSLGTALPMAGMIFGGRSLIQRFGWLQRHLGAIRTIFGLLLAVAGLLILSGLDRQIQIWLLQAFPAWDHLLTGWEPEN